MIPSTSTFTAYEVDIQPPAVGKLRILRSLSYLVHSIVAFRLGRVLELVTIVHEHDSYMRIRFGKNVEYLIRIAYGATESAITSY